MKEAKTAYVNSEYNKFLKKRMPKIYLFFLLWLIWLLYILYICIIVNINKFPSNNNYWLMSKQVFNPIASPLSRPLLAFKEGKFESKFIRTTQMCGGLGNQVYLKNL